MAKHDVEISYENSQEAPVQTITVSGTVTGFETGTSSESVSLKYANAKTELTKAIAAAYALAAVVYVDSGGTGALRNIELSRSIGHNKVAGTITYSISYDDLVVTVENALSESVTVSYNNEDGANQIIAVLGVIGKENGPVIQNMGTTSEKSIGVSVDIVMLRGFRDAINKPDGTALATVYKPAGGFQTAKTESWTPTTGAYNLNIEWVYV